MNVVSREVFVVWLIIFLLFAGTFFGLYRLRQENEALKTQIDTVAVRSDIDAPRIGNQSAATEDLARDLEGRVEAFQSAIENNSGKINSVEADNQQIAARVESLQNRLAGIEQNNTSLAELMETLTQRIASVESATERLSTVEADIQQLTGRANSLSSSLERLVGKVEQDNTSLIGLIRNLLERIEEVERTLQKENPVTRASIRMTHHRF